MRRSAFALLLPLAAFLWSLTPGCSGNDKSTPAPILGKAGESCQSRGDCEGDLSCFNNVCTAKMEEADSGAPQQPVVQSQAGESCAARVDCVLGLACINNVCIGVDVDASTQKGAGERGESCRSRADCTAGLACVSNVCAKADFGIVPTAKVCALIDCMTAKDCCPKTANTNCAFYAAQCGDAGSGSFYCQLYEDTCKCKEDLYACTPDNKCITKYSCADGGAGCPFGYVCNNGTECVRCLKDADCASGQACTAEHTCVTSCVKHSDCNYLQDCKNGVCVETGCTTNRECIAKNLSPLSTCQMGKCQTPCQTDAECNAGGRYLYQACVSGVCQDIGCETNEECRIRLSGAAVSKDAVCRDKP